jgi:hypothetical protein
VKPLPMGELQAFLANVRSEHPDEDNFGLAQVAAYHILAALFGDDWVEMHITADRAPTNFFRNTSTDDHARTMGRIRLIQLAEMTFNLQYVLGLYKSVQMIQGGDIEAGFAELEVGRILHINDMQFEFVVPKGIEGDDYDLELSFDDVLACCETKCKVETTEVSENTVLNALKHGRKQLPENKPGIIFVKVPPAWHKTDKQFITFLSETTNKFLRNTKRIVSVKFYSSLLVQTDIAYVPTMLQFEMNNARNRFSPDRDWGIFRTTRTPTSWVALMDECARQQ